MFKVQGKDFSKYMTDIKLKLVRTYKGEIKRTQLGKVAAFPTSFVTVGFDVAFLGPREEMKLLQQIFLSADVVEVDTDYDGTQIKGKFSSTSNDYDEVRDKGGKHTTLSLSIVSDGTPITNSSGGVFTAKYSSTTIATGYFGEKVYVGTGYKLDGVSVPSYLLMLGNVNLTR